MAKEKSKFGEVIPYISKKTGKTTYRIKVYFKDKHGKVHRPTTPACKNMREATQSASHLLEQLRQNDGSDIGLTVRDALQNMLPHAEALRSRSTERAIHRYMDMQIMFDIPLVNLRPSHLLDHVKQEKTRSIKGGRARGTKFAALSKKEKQVAESTIKRDVGVLQQAVRELCEQNDLPYPWANVRLKLDASHRRDYLVSDQEIDELRQAAHYTLGDTPTKTRQFAFLVFLFACKSGLRMGEVFMLTNEQVTHDGQMVHLPLTKNGDSRDVPLFKGARQILSWLPPVEDGKLLFGRSQSAVESSFKRLRKTCGHQDSYNGGYRFHDSRHLFCTNMRITGMSVEMVMEIVGHKSREMTERYTNIKADHLLEFATKFEQQAFAVNRETTLTVAA